MIAATSLAMFGGQPGLSRLKTNAYGAFRIPMTADTATGTRYRVRGSDAAGPATRSPQGHTRGDDEILRHSHNHAIVRRYETDRVTAHR
jgi:hypothetical protein